MCSHVISMSLVWACMSSVCNSYIFVCDPYVARMYSMSSVCHSYVLVCSYVIPVSLVWACMSSVCHSYVLICRPCVIRVGWYVIRMSLVCTRVSSICHSYVVLPWTFFQSFLLVLKKLSFWRGDGALGYHSTEFRHFSDIS